MNRDYKKELREKKTFQERCGLILDQLSDTTTTPALVEGRINKLRCMGCATRRHAINTCGFQYAVDLKIKENPALRSLYEKVCK